MRALLLLAAAWSAPAFAQQVDPLAPIDPPTAQPQTPAATTPTPTPAPPRVVPRDWRGVFAAIRAEDWAAARAGIGTLPDGPLKPVAKAELYTARNSPRVELSQILSLLAEAPDLPEAEQLQRLAMTRGATEPPAITVPRQTIFLGSAQRRQRARAVANEPLADALRTQLEPLVVADDAAGAEALLFAQGPYLSAEARAEAGQRVAWIYYVLNRDTDARRVADQWRQEASGEWAGQAAWISGLASWRLGECLPAARSFREVPGRTTDRELAAAAYYWAARAEQSCRRPREVEPLLRAAARSPESFYGLVARETLGMPTHLPAQRLVSRGAAERPNVLRAQELMKIGEWSLADALLRYQARVGPANEHAELTRLAGSMGLPGTQYWLAHNGPRGAEVDPALRFPTAGWAPSQGWRIDPALAFAHARQESDFRPAVISPAGAVGLMQVRPGTAGDFARARGVALGDLTNPSTNLEYGQSFIELMRGKAATQGQIVKVIAAYNAGPVPVDRWAYVNDRGDPLLWIESLPYWETRYYVPSVLRNMFVYQGMANAPQPELKALAEHKWPAFPVAHRR